MATKFTAGPWHVAPPEYGWDHFAAILDKDGIIAACRIASLSRDHEQTAANARLMAAAPDLYDALSDILEQIYLNDEDGLSEHAECVVRARAALARARGEQS